MKKKILIVDDEENFARMVKLNLEETGDFMVRAETRGANALTAAKEFRPDLVLLDVMMPDVDGADVAFQIKSDPSLKNVKVVFLTAIVKEDEVATTSKDGSIGGHPFIAKPVTTAKLIEHIKKYIG